jgi:hypothetical protein
LQTETANALQQEVVDIVTGDGDRGDDIEGDAKYLSYIVLMYPCLTALLGIVQTGEICTDKGEGVTFPSQEERWGRFRFPPPPDSYFCKGHRERAVLAEKSDKLTQRLLVLTQSEVPWVVSEEGLSRLYNFGITGCSDFGEHVSLGAILNENGLGRWHAKFEAEDITLHNIAELTNDDLKELAADGRAPRRA